ncbi:glycosyltransferase family 24 protein [Oidiodendron maius Zn]|uniref:Glycosyltransferase family 24 protein n=1 Tax=Oidiodendron maius (strain Zn) TaxID=913774 RepID=A0A0C3HEZ1_OIDMZ|nr:glycosyltransferase family 24 protein [Oidiodendron maius Zn]
MRAMSFPWGLTGALLASTYLHSLCVSASPSINVELRASFSSAPYLLELLETAGDENSTSYFPLLDRIADGHFSKASTDKELYDQFIQVLKEDGHMSDPHTLSSFQFALSMRSSAPRIEAHYQYYHTSAEPYLQADQEPSCSIWVLFNDKQYCSPLLEEANGDVSGHSQAQELQFDRVLGSRSAPATVLYADITSPSFGQFHKSLVKAALEGKTSYRIRHRNPTSEFKPLTIPGYGVELALKRTDYIVIDDREDNEAKTSNSDSETKVKFEDEEFADLKPLSSSELLNLSVKASSFIMQSEEPFDTLIKLSQDFPKYSSAIATHNATDGFVTEHEYNRAQLVPAGYNVWWINGVQLIERQINGLSLLEILRKERKLIKGVTNLGFTVREAIDLLAHTEISTVKVDNEPPRYDWRDDIEGGSTIIWMNNLEKDKRYAEWPESLSAMLQQTFPGQLPSVRRDCFTLVVPVDFTDMQDVYLVADTLLSFVKRKLALRIGIVPIAKTSNAAEQAAIVYHLLDTYGLAAATEYLGVSYNSKSVEHASKSNFESVIKGKGLRPDKTSHPFDDVLKSDEYKNQVQFSQKWIQRLGANSDVPPMFVNGVAIPRDENFLQAMSSRVSTDLRAIQAEIFKESIEPDAWLPSYFLTDAVLHRNTLVAPEDDKSLRIFDVNKLMDGSLDILQKLPRVEVDPSSAKAEWAYMTVVADLNSEAGGKLLSTAVSFRKANPSVELVVVHNPAPEATNNTVSNYLFSYMRGRSYNTVQNADELIAHSNAAAVDGTGLFQEEANRYWQTASSLVRSIAFQPGQNGLLLNGRLLGPVPDTLELELADFEQLLSYERSNRISPAYAAVDALGLLDKITEPLVAAKISSIVALSTISDTPDGIFEKAPTIRLSFNDVWNSSHTVIEIGDISTASIQMTLLVDPASEQGQRWLPIIQVVSELDGVYLKLFLNPKGRLQELPVKRFYRYVLGSKPTFDESGDLQSLGASFTGVPQEALLTVGMDTPPAWLVAPKTSIHDLDNIKLSSVKSDVKAIYELKNILIEGHSREIPGGAAPSGAQLVLGTEREPHFADTIIMANLGYFQFKANPGFYKINLQEGRSSEIFKIESIGSQGWAPVPGDESSEVVLMSFQGATLYPRLSRKTGMETEDVLEATADSPLGFVSRGLNFAQGILSGKTHEVQQETQAEINIFSVASGHLYERMLNIMMVSVMKHTKHTVKFWFIEQFLSPSFKDFIPYLAAEYGFQYEMVTFKWPHWLRKQTEKQREIWGYKILFLDVLFPLSLDKVIFVDADQIVRTDMIDLVNHDLKGAPYGFTPMCDSRTEMEGFRFWKQGYWEKFLRGLPYHISALYVVDLQRFRQMAAGDRLRQQYHSLSADPNSLSNLDQDLPNHMQTVLPIHSLPQEWLWCETWCSDESLKEARTIDLCNNPLTKEPKLDRARRQVPEWTVYDDEIAGVDRKRKGPKEPEDKTESKTVGAKEGTSSKDEL